MVYTLHTSKPVMKPVFKVLQNGLLRYFTHVQTCNVTRVQSATEWTASVHTFHMWGEISSRWKILRHHLWNLGPGYHVGRLEELLILNRPCRPGEDVKDSVVPRSNRQAWWNWESTKQEFENMVTKSGVIR